MEIEILSPSALIYSGTIKQVNLPGVDGSFEILDNHAPIIAGLQAGDIILVDEQGQKQTFPIVGGVVEQSKHKVIVLTE